MAWDGIERRKCPVENECRFESMIRETHKAVCGNGDPTQGILWKVAKNTETMDKISRLVKFWENHWWKILIAIIVWMGSSVMNCLVEIVKSHITLH